MPRTDVFYDGKVHVMKKMCPTCIGWPGNRMDLNDGRRDEMVAGAIEMDGQIPCHSTLHLTEGAVCRWYFDKHRTSTLQIAERLGFIEEFELEEEIDERRDDRD